jgi:hypothetical protein
MGGVPVSMRNHASIGLSKLSTTPGRGAARAACSGTRDAMLASPSPFRGHAWKQE